MHRYTVLIVGLLCIVTGCSTKNNSAPSTPPDRQFTGIPARTSGPLTDGPPAAELAAAVAARLPEDWFVKMIFCSDNGDMTLLLAKWPPTGKDYFEGRYDKVNLELSSEDAKRPIAEVVRMVNARRLTSGTSPATRPAETLELLDVPPPDRQVIVGWLDLSWIHMNTNGPDHGVYYEGRITDRRTGRSEFISMFAMFTPFADIAVTVDGLKGNVVVVKDEWGNDQRSFQMIIPQERFGSPTSQPAFDFEKGDTYQLKPWTYRFGTSAKQRFGFLFYEGKELGGDLTCENVNDYYKTPWGRLYWHGTPKSWHDHKWMPYPDRSKPEGRPLTVPNITLIDSK